MVHALSSAHVCKLKESYYHTLIITAGRGFQKSPIVGKILAELALDLSPSYDVSLFSLARFQKKKSKL